MARPRNPFPRFNSRFAATFLTVVMAGLFGCGGGTEVAPPTPVVDGDGFGQATLDGVSRGETEIVSSLVPDSTTLTFTVTGEMPQFGASGFLTTANRPLADPISLFGPGGTNPDGSYERALDGPTCMAAPSCQYWVEDYAAGVLGRNASATTPIPTGVPLTLNYDWSETRLSVEVSLSFGNVGEEIRVVVHNVGLGETGPFTVATYSELAPTDGSKAFDVEMRTGLLLPTGQQKRLVVVADPGNQVVVTGVDLSNPLNPCIQGRVISAMTDSVDADPANPNHLEATFDDSDC